MASEGIRVAAHQVGGVSACRSDRQEAGFIPLNTRVNLSKKTDLGFQLGRSNLCVCVSCVCKDKLHHHGQNILK